MKLCKDCKHFMSSGCDEFCRCKAISEISPITGLKLHVFCVVERAALLGKCGLDGKLFEAEVSMMEWANGGKHE